jgi:hypothetical protein
VGGARPQAEQARWTALRRDTGRPVSRLWVFRLSVRSALNSASCFRRADHRSSRRSGPLEVLRPVCVRPTR